MRSVRSSTAGSSARRTTVGRAVRESTAVRESEAEEPMYVPHLLLHSSTMCLQSFSSASRSSADGDPVRSRRRTGGRGVANRRSADLVVRLCNNMTRFLQLFRAADSDQDGKVSYDEFERVITAMRLGHDPKDSRRLFRALDAEDTGSARLDSLMKLKLDLDDGKFEEFFKNRGVEDALVDDMGPPEESTHGCFRKYIVKPTMGALWKSSLRPHHALETNRHKWLEHTRGTPRVHAMLGLRSYVDDDDEAGTRVVLALVPARGELNAPRRRKVYRAGPVPDFMAWIDQSQESLMQAAQHAATECDDLLTEVRPRVTIPVHVSRTVDVSPSTCHRCVRSTSSWRRRTSRSASRGPRSSRRTSYTGCTSRRSLTDPKPPPSHFRTSRSPSTSIAAAR